MGEIINFPVKPTDPSAEDALQSAQGNRRSDPPGFHADASDNPVASIQDHLDLQKTGPHGISSDQSSDDEIPPDLAREGWRVLCTVRTSEAGRKLVRKWIASRSPL